MRAMIKGFIFNIEALQSLDDYGLGISSTQRTFCEISKEDIVDVVATNKGMNPLSQIELQLDLL